MIRDEVKNVIEKSIRALGLPEGDVRVEHPEHSEHGDFATNIALQCAKKVGRTPMDVASQLVAEIKNEGGYLFEKIETASPGFINFFVSSSRIARELSYIHAEQDKYGSNEYGKGERVRIEFISANPTGPLHFGNARGGPIGDTLARVFERSGYDKVSREYFNNDVGGQVARLGESITNIKKGESLEAQEYKGEYVRELAAGIHVSSDESPETMGKEAVRILSQEALYVAEKLDIRFDTVYQESQFAADATKKTIEVLRGKGMLKEKEGALWFAPNDEFLSDRETVVVKSDGSFTYFANDIAYHAHKFEEGYDLVIDVFGANHHGHVPRLKASMQALGFDPARLRFILYQWVRFKRGQEVVRMAKREGTFVTAEEVVREVGKDSVRFFILMHDADSHIDFDLDLARERSDKNPVYYVQYAHARIASILRKAEAEHGYKELGKGDYELLTHSAEAALIKEVLKFPELIEDTARDFQYQRIPHYAIKLADLFHHFYHECKVLGDDKALTEARVGLVAVTKIVFKNTLDVLGVNAPESM